MGSSRGMLVWPACAVLAALSLLVIPAVPTTDPWGWIVWGRELLSLNLDTAVGGAPSWKPLPVLFTAPLSLAGDAAPVLWVWVARVGGLVGLVLAFRLGSRLAGRGAGLAAALLIVSTGGWFRSMAHGYTEPLLMAIAIAGVGWHLEGRRRAALLALLAVCLARPEVWPVLIAYGCFAVRGEPSLGRIALPAVAAVPLLWVGVDWLASGELLHGGKEAQGVSRSMSFADMLLTAVRVAGLPALLLAAVAAVAEPRVRRTAAVACGWSLFVCLLPVAGYPASERFFAPAVAVACLLGGVGAGSLASTAHMPRAARLAAGWAVAAALVLFAAGRLDGVPAQAGSVRDRAALQAELRRAADDIHTIRADATAVVPYGLQWNSGAVAWELGIPLSRVVAPDPARSPSPSELAARPLASARPLLSRDVRGQPLLRIPLPFDQSGRLVLFVPVEHGTHIRAGAGLRRRSLPSAGAWRVVELRPGRRLARRPGSKR